MDSEIRSLIRQVLAEELSKLRPATNAPPREEAVSLENDEDLARFVRRLMRMGADPATRQAVEDGRLTFRLAKGSSGGRSVSAAPRAVGQPAPAASQRIDKGFVSERQVDALPPGTKVLQVGKAVRFTPLGRDRLRQRGIAIERSER